MRRSNRVTFGEHNDRMHEFRRSHVDIEFINGPKLDEAASLSRLILLRTHQVQSQMGGAVFCSDVSGNEHLAPMWKIAPYRLSLN